VEEEQWLYVFKLQMVIEGFIRYYHPNGATLDIDEVSGFIYTSSVVCLYVVYHLELL
jgi:hypothetical protein